MAKAKPAEKQSDTEEKDTKPGASKTSSKEEGDESGEVVAEEPGAKKSKKKIIIIGVGALALLLAGLGGAYYMGLFGKHESTVAVEVGPDGKPIEKAIFYTLPEILVNLNSGGKSAVFLKATVIFQVAHQSDIPQIETNLPILLDTLNTYLRELRPSDLSGSAGIQRLREELLLRANKTLAPVKIGDVLFKEIIVQ